MEIRYESVRKWLDKAEELRTTGKEPKCADDPLRRQLAFSDSDENYHYLSLTKVMEATKEEKDLLSKAEGRKKLIEEGLTSVPHPL